MSRFLILCRHESESDRIKNWLPELRCANSRANNIARVSAVNIDEWLGSRLLLTQGAKTAAAPAASPIFDPSVKILLKPSYADRSSLTLVSYRVGETSDLLPSSESEN